MFLGKRKIKYDTKNIQLVPFCKDCDSQEVETIQTCKKCGSHNIGHGKLFDDDPRGQKKIIEEKEEPFYKCDYCGKEFNGFKTPTTMYYSEGEFEFGTPGEYDDENAPVYSIEGDVCLDCLKKVKDKLSKSIYDIVNVYNVQNVAKEVLGERKDENGNDNN